MASPGKQIPVLTPAFGRRYNTKKDCLDAYLSGVEFIFNMQGDINDGQVVTIASTYYTVVKFRFGKQSMVYEGN